MLCQYCKKNPVTVSYTENINGKKSEFRLCSECYLKICGESDEKLKDVFSFFDMPKRRVKSCAVCGTTYADYERTGLLGCASCYDMFKDELIHSVLKIQGKTEHVGKRGGKQDDLLLNVKLKNLQGRLEQALRDKRFGEADALNRQIAGIKKTLGGGGNG